MGYTDVRPWPCAYVLAIVVSLTAFFMLSMSISSRRDLTLLHLAVMLFGAAGLFSSFIDGGSAVIVSGRTLFASLALLAYALVCRSSLRIARADVPAFALSGVLLSAHWWTFFHAIQVSSVAFGLLGFSVFPVFVILLEPYLARDHERAGRRDYVLAACVMFGLLLVVPEYRMQNSATAGLAWGVLSALLFAVLVLMNRRLTRYGAVSQSFWQNAVAALVLAPLGWPLLLQSSATGWIAVILLGLVFTALAHGLFIASLRTIPARKAAVIVALEPVYGIVFAGLLFAQWPTGRSLLGGAILLMASTLASLPKARAGQHS